MCKVFPSMCTIFLAYFYDIFTLLLQGKWMKMNVKNNEKEQKKKAKDGRSFWIFDVDVEIVAKFKRGKVFNVLVLFSTTTTYLLFVCCCLLLLSVKLQLLLPTTTTTNCNFNSPTMKHFIQFCAQLPTFLMSPT